MNPAIADILAGCKKGDPRMQKELYRHFYHDMMKICLRYTGDIDKASVVYNNAMLKIFRKIGEYKEQEKAAPWVKRIVVNTAIDYVRIKSNFLLQDAGEIKEDSHYPVPAAVFEKMNGDEIRRLIFSLPEKIAVVFNLYVYEEYDHNEIGKLLNIPPGTSRYYLSEARRLLKEKVLNPNFSLTRAI